VITLTLLCIIAIAIISAIMDSFFYGALLILVVVGIVLLIKHFAKK
jgi:hypothetical protein